MSFRKTDNLDEILGVPDFDYNSNSKEINSESANQIGRVAVNPAKPSREEAYEKQAYLSARDNNNGTRTSSDEVDSKLRKQLRKEKAKEKKRQKKLDKAYDREIERELDYNSGKKRKGPKNKRRKFPSAGHKNGSAFSKLYSLVYLACLAFFELVIGILHVLPIHYFIALTVILCIISAIIIIQLTYPNVKKWARITASILSVLLIGVYGVGIVYAGGTMFFLNGVSSNVKNENRVDNVAKDPFTILFTGMDVEGTIKEEGRSDVNMLATVNPQTGEILLTSIPRDYEIRLVNYDYARDKITHTGFYGTDDTILAVEDLLDIKVNYYIKVNFTSVEKVVDAIGGIDVYSDYEFNPVKYDTWTVQEGWNHMNGEQALAFARERKAFADGDNQRVKNQQQVLEAMLKKTLSGRTLVLKYTKLLNSMSDYMEMNFSSREVRKLVRLQVAKNIDWNIDKQSLTGFDASMVTYSTGGEAAYVMEQDKDSISAARAYIEAVMNGEDLSSYRTEE